MLDRAQATGARLDSRLRPLARRSAQAPRAGTATVPGAAPARARRARGDHEGTRDGGAPHDLGHAGVGRTAVTARTARRPTSTHCASSPTASPTRYPSVTRYSIWNEPNTHLFLVAAVRLRRPLGRAAHVRRHLPRRVRGDQGGEPGGARRDRRDGIARARRAVTRPGAGPALAGALRAAPLHGEPAPRVRRVGAPPVPDLTPASPPEAPRRTGRT